jgi:hypothetical protein
MTVMVIKVMIRIFSLDPPSTMALMQRIYTREAMVLRLTRLEEKRSMNILTNL